MNLTSVGIGDRQLVRPVAIAKGRSYSVPNERGSYYTQDLYVFDGVLDRFVIYTVPHVTGFITPDQVLTTVPVRIVPNPIPGAYYTQMTFDAWGNLYALDRSQGRICKFDHSLRLLDTYGSFGTGSLGTEQMLGPVSLSFARRKNQDGSIGQARDAVLAEKCHLRDDYHITSTRS